MTADPNSPLSMGQFPRNADEFFNAVEDLFSNPQYDVFVLDHDPSDDTFLLYWMDRNGNPRKTWVTDLAMDTLTSRWTLN